MINDEHDKTSAGLSSSSYFSWFAVVLLCRFSFLQLVSLPAPSGAVFFFFLFPLKVSDFGGCCPAGHLCAPGSVSRVHLSSAHFFPLVAFHHRLLLYSCRVRLAADTHHQQCVRVC